MGKASSNKKVARAASTGGGRTARGARPWGWYGAMAVVAVVGTMVIVGSRNERQAASNPLKSEKPRPPSLPGQKPFGGDHWHAALGIYACDGFLPPVTSDNDPRGIHTHGDGVIHIHPFTKSSAGRNATLGVYTDTVGIKVNSTSVQVPGGKRYKNGDTCPNGKKGTLRVYLNGDERPGDPKDIRLRDRDRLVVAFAPSGTDVPKTPPSFSELDNLNDVPGSPGLTVPGSVPGGAGPAAPDATTSSSPPGEAPTTTPAGPSTTSAP